MNRRTTKKKKNEASHAGVSRYTAGRDWSLPPTGRERYRPREREREPREESGVGARWSPVKRVIGLKIQLPK